MAQYAFYPPSGSGSANASVGPNGSPIPTSATLVAGENPSGNLQPLQTDASGALVVTGESGGLPLNVNIADYGGVATTLGQKTSAASMPVVLASDQSALLVIQPTASLLNATIAPLSSTTSSIQVLQSTPAALQGIMQIRDSSGAVINANAGNLDINLNQYGGTSTTLGQKVSASSIPVVIASDQGSFPISGTVTANQGTANATPWNENISQYGGVATSLGSKVSASSMPVVIASDQSAVTVAQATAANLNATVVGTGGAALATSANQTNGSQKVQNVDGAGSVVGPNQTIAGTNYLPVVLAASATPGSAIVSRSIQVAGSDGTNARTLSTDASGNVNVNILSAPAASGSVPLQFVRNNYSSTNVTTAAYVQLIASTSGITNVIETFDSSGQTLEIAFGAPGSEVNQFLIFPGGNGRATVRIPASTRVSIRAVSATASSGEFDLNLYT